MESLSGDDDNAFAVTQRSPLAGGGWAHCVCVLMGNISFVCPLLEVKVIKITGDILVID